MENILPCSFDLILINSSDELRFYQVKSQIYYMHWMKAAKMLKNNFIPKAKLRQNVTKTY